MIRLFACCLIVLFAASSPASAADLEKELDGLAVNEPAPQPEQTVTYHAVQERNPILANRFSLNVGAGTFITGNGFLSSRSMGLQAIYYATNNLGFGFGYSSVSNKFNESAERLATISNLMPDVDYATSRIEATAMYNLLYGKFRITPDTAFIFDQYFELGLASNALRSGSSMGPVAGVGFAFWLNRFNFRIAFKDYYYQEHYAYTEGSYHNVSAGLSAGYLF